MSLASLLIANDTHPKLFELVKVKYTVAVKITLFSAMIAIVSLRREILFFFILLL